MGAGAAAALLATIALPACTSQKAEEAREPPGNVLTLAPETAPTLPPSPATGAAAPAEKKIVRLSLILGRDGTVTERVAACISAGIPSLRSPDTSQGEYEIRVHDAQGNIVWRENLDVYFGYRGPVFRDRDYSDIVHDEILVGFSRPYTPGMRTVSLVRNGRTLYSRDLRACEDTPLGFKMP